MEKTDFKREIQAGDRKMHIYDINLLEERGIAQVRRLPFSIRILVENLLRKLDGKTVTEKDLLNIARWRPHYEAPVEIPYHPGRVLMQDFTGVPAVVDLAAMRDAVKDLGGDPARINPLVPTELVVDHSVQVDYFGTSDAVDKNVALEYQRNGERYALLKWAQESFDNFSVVPPSSGICHQVNLEYLGRVVITRDEGGALLSYPDTLVGTDSHTPMINGIGVMGWGVGGIEAEAVMLGQPYYMSIPEVVGVRLTGALQEGVTATDLVLTVTERLRRLDVVEKFVEYFGPGVKNLEVPDRATISNMTPEYGATLGFFPVDEATIAYLAATGRETQAGIVEAGTKALGLFFTGAETPEYSQVVEIDLSQVEPSVAGPSRPQDRIALRDLKAEFAPKILGRENAARQKPVPLELDSRPVVIQDGSVVIAAITSCTNTSNPFVLLGAGLMARRAVEKGLKVPAYVKTSFAPGSRVVSRYMEASGLMPYLEALGFHLAGFGCTTCIGNSGPLRREIEEAIQAHGLNVAAVLSGNRNFEARIHQRIKSNFLMSPLLVVAFALAGRIDVDLTKEPLAHDPNGEPVFLKDIWPSSGQIREYAARHVTSDFFRQEYETIFAGDRHWQELSVPRSTTFAWDPASTYIKKPPYFDDFSPEPGQPAAFEDARALLLLGDSITTDHISPAGAIPVEYPAGEYLLGHGVPVEEFNSYGARRGNHEVMMRGTFANIRIKNQLTAPREGGLTKKFPDGREMYVFDAAMAYQNESVPLLVLGGKEYGTGSSRDWAAKGTTLLGVRAVIARSYERIHRSNLIGMGVLPLMFQNGDSWQELGLDGSERFFIDGIAGMTPRKFLPVKAVKQDGSEICFEVVTRLDTAIEVDYFVNGGILPFVLRKLFRA